MKFSIVIPVYNAAPYLRECLDSLLAQTYDSWESICVDDGSTDASGAILDEYATKDARFRVLHQQNAGVYKARNAGLQLANGEWLYFVDADDYLSPWALQTFVEMSLKNHHASLLRISKADIVDVSDFHALAGDPWKVTSRDITKCLSYEETCPNVWLFAIKKDALSNTVFRPFRYGEDRIFMAECFARVNFWAFTDRVCYGYRRTPGSITHRALSLEAFKSFIDHNVVVKNVFVNSGKVMERGAMRMLLNFWTEMTRDMIRLVEKGDPRREASRYWILRLKEFFDARPMTLWYAVTLRICYWMRMPFVGWLLYGVPYSLKKKGFHR